MMVKKLDYFLQKIIKSFAEALVDHDESGSRAVYAERIHKNLSDYQPEDSSDSQ